jgi:hypothetical protein
MIQLWDAEQSGADPLSASSAGCIACYAWPVCSSNANQMQAHSSICLCDALAGAETHARRPVLSNRMFLLLFFLFLLQNLIISYLARLTTYPFTVVATSPSFVLLRFPCTFAQVPSR